MILGFIVGMLWATPFWIIFGLFFKDDLEDKREVCSFFIAWLLSVAIAFIPSMLGYNPYVSYRNIYRVGLGTYNQTQLRGSIIVGACSALVYAGIFTVIAQELLLGIFGVGMGMYKYIVKRLKKLI